MSDHDSANLIKGPARLQAQIAVQQFEKQLLSTALPTPIINQLVTYKPKHHLTNLMFSPDQSFMVANSGNAIFLWDPVSLKTFQIFEPTAWDTPIVITPDNRRVITADAEHCICVWDIPTGRCVQALAGHSTHIGQLALSPDGKTLVSTSHYEASRLWDLEKGSYRVLMSTHDSDVVFCPDGKSFLTASGHAVKQWDLQTGEFLAEFREQEHGNRHHHIVISPNGQTVVTATVYDSVLRVLNLETGTFRRMEDHGPGRSGGSRAINISPNGQYLLTCDYYNYLKLWDLQSGYCLERIPGNWESLAFSPDSQTFAAFELEDSQLQVWDLHSGQIARSITPDGSYLNLTVISGDGHLLVTEGKRFDLTVWDLETGLPRCSLNGHTKYCKAAAFSPDGSLLLSGADDHTLRLWDLQNGHCLGVWPKGEAIKAVAISPTGNLAAVAVNTHVLIQNLLTGEVLKRLNGSETPVKLLQFSADGNWLYSVDNYRDSGKKKSIRRWAVETGICEAVTRILPHNFKDIQRLTVSIESGCWMTAERGGEIVQRDIDTGEIINTFASFEGSAKDLVVRPGGEWVVVVDNGNHVLAWSLVSKEQREFAGLPQTAYRNEISSLAFSPNGRILMAVGFDSVITFWDWESGDVLARMFNLHQGYLWMTPPDDIAAEGWLHTNRPDLISLMAVDDEGRVKEYIPEADERFAEFMRLHNDQEMVMKRLNDPQRYEELRRLRTVNLETLSKPGLESGTALRYLSAESKTSRNPS